MHEGARYEFIREWWNGWIEARRENSENAVHLHPPKSLAAIHKHEPPKKQWSQKPKPYGVTKLKKGTRRGSCAKSGKEKRDRKAPAKRSQIRDGLGDLDLDRVHGLLRAVILGQVEDYRAQCGLKRSVVAQTPAPKRAAAALIVGANSWTLVPIEILQLALREGWQINEPIELPYSQTVGGAVGPAFLLETRDASGLADALRAAKRQGSEQDLPRRCGRGIRRMMLDSVIDVCSAGAVFLHFTAQTRLRY